MITFSIEKCTYQINTSPIGSITIYHGTEISDFDSIATTYFASNSIEFCRMMAECGTTHVIDHIDSSGQTKELYEYWLETIAAQNEYRSLFR